MNDSIPILPYGGRRPNSGHAGSDTSEARATREDSDGTTSARQRTVLDYLETCGERGATWVDIATHFGMHHGGASGALSALHEVRRVARLSETRSRSKVYVLPQYVADRPTEARGRVAASEILADAVAVCRSFMDDCKHGLIPEPGCRSCEATEIVRRYQNTYR